MHMNSALTGFAYIRSASIMRPSNMPGHATRNQENHPGSREVRRKPLSEGNNDNNTCTNRFAVGGQPRMSPPAPRSERRRPRSCRWLGRQSRVAGMAGRGLQGPDRLAVAL